MSHAVNVGQEDLAARLPDSRPAVRAAIADYVRRVAIEFADEVASITLYGSQARGEAGAESDIDLFIVVGHDTPNLRQKLADLAWQVQFEHNVVISDIIRSLDELHQLQLEQFPYYQSIKREGVHLWKSPSRLTPAYV